MTELDRLRKLAEAVQAGAGHLYSLDWKAVQESDEIGVYPRVLIGGKYSTPIRIGCWNEQEGAIIQTLADYIAALHPVLILELLDRVGRDTELS